MAIDKYILFTNGVYGKSPMPVNYPIDRRKRKKLLRKLNERLKELDTEGQDCFCCDYGTCK